MTKRILRNGEPYFFRGGEIGCVLVHGFTATPKEMRYLGEYLNERGFTVVGVRLAGHATKPEDMERMNFESWLACVEDGFHLIKDVCSKVFIVGLSMGGALTLTFSSLHEVDGVVSMAAPYHLETPISKERFLIPIYRIVSYFKHFQKKGPGNWFRPEQRDGRISYPVNPLRNVSELLKLLRILRVQIPKITAPTLVIHSIDDLYVLPENAEMIFEALAVEDKELFFVEKSTHVITEDGDREKVFKKVYEFIQRVSGVGHD